jgi:hypothetical protein
MPYYRPDNFGIDEVTRPEWKPVKITTGQIVTIVIPSRLFNRILDRLVKDGGETITTFLLEAARERLDS